MNSKTTSEKLIQFIENSPSAFHTVETIKFLLLTVLPDSLIFRIKYFPPIAYS